MTSDTWYTICDIWYDDILYDSKSVLTGFLTDRLSKNPWFWVKLQSNFRFSAKCQTNVSQSSVSLKNSPLKKNGQHPFWIMIWWYTIWWYMIWWYMIYIYMTYMVRWCTTFGGSVVVSAMGWYGGIWCYVRNQWESPEVLGWVVGATPGLPLKPGQLCRLSRRNLWGRSVEASMGTNL